MSLVNLVNNDRTDKNTVHSYLPLYDILLSNRKECAKNILEVGIQGGGSIKLWHDYFPNAVIYGVDIMQPEQVWEELLDKERIVLHTGYDAYRDDFLDTFFSDKKGAFDMVLDDGPHTLESMRQFIRLYLPLLNKNGILIIEDVQSWDWIDELKKELGSEELLGCSRTYDLRSNKDRYDDIVFAVDLSLLL
jgi:hypothetical protein